ncbi:hypothetical protein L596_014200 [Steinernema carpocapsae]|uniref:Uncharacterized protein n=1 Tax=Steinernema carpocapsae TaxID=34508 RepID=A0A4U5NB42_STECR|nr:hypothetical protein L596_014200 [Steinernema carpocapsae]
MEKTHEIRTTFRLNFSPIGGDTSHQPLRRTVRVTRSLKSLLKPEKTTPQIYPIFISRRIVFNPKEP